MPLWFVFRMARQVQVAVASGGDSETKAGAQAMDALITERNLRTTSYDDWLVLKKMEEDAASESAPRRKFSSVDAMLAALDATQTNG